MTAEERIKQKAKTASEIEKEMLATWEKDGCKEKKAEKWVTVEDVLQILAEYKIVPLVKWRELLKLLQNHPRFYPFESNYRLRELRDYFEKIEEKLEEITK